MADSMDSETIEEEMTAGSEDSDSGDDSEDSDIDEKLNQKIREMEERIMECPYQYDLYTQLIKLLRAEGELDKLRESRKKMHAIFPLSQQLWLEWIEDEMKFSSDDREMINELFDTAVVDYTSVDIWLEYVQYVIGGMAEPDGIDRIRQVFERAITAVGLHVNKGAMVWDAYREFENAILMGLQPSLGSVTTPEQQEQINAQTNRVSALFRRQLAVPLLDMEGTYTEYQEWCTDDVDKNTHIEQAYTKAKQRLVEVMPYEDALLKSEPPHLDEYQKYIEYEVIQGEPARVQCVYERAILENCLIPQLWVDYGKYVDSKLRVGSLAVSVYERSIRNCPWCADLWLSYARALERHHHDHDKIKGLYEQALQTGFTQGVEYLLIWTAYCDYLRRRINWEQDDSKELEELRGLFRRATTHLTQNYPEDGDPNCTLLQYWARLEAKYCKNMEASRQLWNEILQQGFGNQASSWIEYFNLERAYGDHKHCRKILIRAVNSVTDFPEGVFETYVNFEREEGSLENYDQAVSKCEVQLSRLKERRAKAAEKESNLAEQKKKQRNEKKSAKKVEQKQQKSGQGGGGGKWETPPSHTVTPPLQALEVMAGGVSPQLTGQKRKHETSSPVKTDADGFKVPALPDVKPKMARLGNTNLTSSHHHSDNTQQSSINSKTVNTQKSENTEHPGHTRQICPNAPPGYTPKPQGSAPPGYKPKCTPPPGFKPKQEGTEESPQNQKPSSNEAEQMDTSEARSRTDMAHHSCTVFVSNLAFNVNEKILQKTFAELGETNVRLVKNFKGQSKGFAYIEFEDELMARRALEMDRVPIDKRPMYVSPFIEKGTKTTGPKFKYDVGLEKNKLFVKGLPFTMTQEAIETLFKQHGPLKSVRLVTYRSGQSKGLAYIEYQKEADASQAVMKTDQLQVGENTITVAISNPPERKLPMTQRDTSSFTPTLGSGKRETTERGKARTQLSLVPRSLQKVPPSCQKPKPKSAQNKTAESSAANGDSPANTASSNQGKLTNTDFRNMLLGNR